MLDSFTQPVLGSSQAQFSDMAIQQTKKQSDLEKRLQLLRHQVYGSSREYSLSNQALPKHQSATINSDVTYLHKDLLKILALSSLAIGAQIILYYLKFF